MTPQEELESIHRCINDVEERIAYHVGQIEEYKLQVVIGELSEEQAAPFIENLTQGKSVAEQEREDYVLKKGVIQYALTAED